MYIHTYIIKPVKYQKMQADFSYTKLHLARLTYGGATRAFRLSCAPLSLAPRNEVVPYLQFQDRRVSNSHGLPDLMLRGLARTANIYSILYLLHGDTFSTLTSNYPNLF